MRLIGNVLWFVLAGFWLFVSYTVAALLCFVFVITIPFGVAALRIALYGVWPFGRAVVPQAGKGAGSTLGNVLWFVLGGWWLAIVHVVTGALLCLTIIGIPLGIANFKLISVSARPFGREIVSAEEAARRGAAAATVPRL
ncbi:YccF domain-containing protein [Patulibacter defluvii]|uniref:YccF domain-containing protein n=1 Tax=Patulibacter defluvii TaxID=3095358 RepID=UPI002A756C0F|nr:YccF domain-containing protein [Patulibacter sp. DM4]